MSRKNRCSPQKTVQGRHGTVSQFGLRADLQKGMALFQSGRLADAERVFQSVLAIDPKNINALQLLGIIQFQTGRFQDGEKLLRRAIKQKSNIADLHYNLGNMLEQQGKLEQAAKSYKKASELNPNNEGVHNNLGMVLSKIGRLDEAEMSIREALNINPQNPSALSNLGLLLRKTDRLDEAIQALEQAIKVAPRFVYAISNLGSIFFERNELDKAEVHLKRALEIDAHNCDVMNNLAGVLMHKAKDTEALAMTRKALNICPESIETLLNMATVLLKKDDEEEAENAYQRILEIMPSNVRALVGIGTILTNQGKFNEARDVFLRALQVDPDRISVRAGLLDVDSPNINSDEVRDLEMEYNNNEISEEDKIRAAFSLAKVFERGEQYKGAFGYLSDGNRLKRKSYEYDLEYDRGLFAKIKSTFSQQFLLDNDGLGCRDNTPIFILGMPRSGTTLTEQIISSHSKVYGAGELGDLKKLVTGICGADVYEKFPEVIRQRFGPDDYNKLGLDYIAGLRKRDSDSERITDKMPHNFIYVGLIKLMLPNAKIIHCQRDPVDNCLSIFKQDFAVLHKYAYDQYELGSYYLLYQDLMNHWRKVLPRFMFDLQYEEMVADQEGVTRRLLEFCELPWDGSCLQFHKSERAVKTASYMQVRKKIYSDSVELWRRYEGELQPLINTLSGKGA